MLHAPGLASADPTKEDIAKADALYNKGVALMEQGKFSEACPLFAESQRIAPGGGTLINLASCHESLGLTATAYVEWAEALRYAQAKKKPERVKKATDRMAQLKERLSYVRIAPPPTMVAESSFVVLIDDRTVDKTWWAEEHPIDPGLHYVEARADGRKSWRKSFNVAPDSDHQVVAVSELEPLAPAEPVKVAPSVVAKPATVPVEPAPVRHTGPSGQVVAGYTVAGVGLLGLIACGVLVGAASSSESSANSAYATNPALGQSRSDARTERALAWVGLGVGVVGLTTGAILLLTAHPKRESAPHAAFAPVAAPGFGGFAITGSF
jgi:tetratricopeptide (TPR) repeat protein